MEPVKSHWQQHNALGESLVTGPEGAGVKIFSGSSMAMHLTQTSLFGKDVAMQIAALNTPYLNESEVPAEIIAHEKEVMRQQVINEGKPEQIADFGSAWAYYELGWGGWWFWDPVENASFMPWLRCV